MANKDFYTVIYKEELAHSFPIEAENPAEALEVFEQLNNKGEIDFSDGEVVDTDLYVKEQERVIDPGITVEIEHYKNDSIHYVEKMDFPSLEAFADHLFDISCIKESATYKEPKPAVRFGKFADGKPTYPMSYDTNISAASTYDYHRIHTIRNSDNEYLYTDGELTGGKRYASDRIMEWAKISDKKLELWQLPLAYESPSIANPDQVIPYKYTLIATCEDDRYRTSGYNLSHWTDEPWDGLLCDVVHADTADELIRKSAPQEGRFYQLFENGTGERVGYGTIDFDSIREEIELFESGRFEKKESWTYEYLAGSTSKTEAKDALDDNLDIVSCIQQEIAFDDENDSRYLLNAYINANDHDRAVMDSVCVNLCGYSLSNIIDKAREQEMFLNDERIDEQAINEEEIPKEELPAYRKEPGMDSPDKNFKK